MDWAEGVDKRIVEEGVYRKVQALSKPIKGFYCREWTLQNPLGWLQFDCRPLLDVCSLRKGLRYLWSGFNSSFRLIKIVPARVHETV